MIYMNIHLVGFLFKLEEKRIRLTEFLFTPLMMKYQYISFSFHS